MSQDKKGENYLSGYNVDKQKPLLFESDFDSVVNQRGCGQVYYKLEDCIAKYDRDWSKCQMELLDLRKCFAKSIQNNQK